MIVGALALPCPEARTIIYLKYAVYSACYNIEPTKVGFVLRASGLQPVGAL
ncbi:MULTISPECIES: hypothetical protein [Calothrix]|uniref:Uncharacterized protein n=2 Tax=Calothrix TaxID=1186 RepID=A0ABR8ACW5_9CYAN|nr:MULTISPECIES: hypothetical protein [Calothrix]MBD2197856.1 hypothetical protein [Calothrix parietina FACHB-288]MBD2226260.1 hypothetical protein [Calothrix anomala FACHB-343]